MLGDRCGVALVAILTAAITFVNLGAALWMKKSESNNGVGDLFVGSCSTASTYSRNLHVVINILSSILLSGSNYCMQRLCAPTRNEIDRQHEGRGGFDVGIPSLQNLKQLPALQQILWVLLALSSLPLHLLYNSAIFTTIAARDYHTTMAQMTFLEGYPIGPANNRYSRGYIAGIHDGYIDGTRRFENISNIDCIDNYKDYFSTKYGEVIAITQDHFNPEFLLGTNASVGVSSTPSREGQLRVIGEAFAPQVWLHPANITRRQNEENYQLGYGLRSAGGGPLGRLFICLDHSRDGTCDIAALRADAQNWTVAGAKIRYCLAEKATESCKLQYSSAIMWWVVASNFVKSLCMLAILIMPGREVLLTIGDAMASFLQQSDPRWSRPPITWTDNARRKRKRLFSTVSSWIWISCIGLCFVTLIIGVALFVVGKAGPGNPSFATLWVIRIGTLRQDYLIVPSIGSSLTGAAVLANLPQLLLSCIYVFYNACFTAMCAAVEWASFSEGKHKSLRVSRPQGEQRSTFWLQLPYYYSLPILAGMTALHWLISQSVFLASIVYYDHRDEVTRTVVGCGYSCAAIFLVLMSGVSLMLAPLVMSVREIPGSPLMPIVCTNSRAIAAACHALDEDVDVACKRLKWGVLVRHGGEHWKEERDTRCYFTTFEVAEPVQ